MDSGSNNSGGVHSGHISLGSTPYEDFVQDLDSPQGTAARQAAVSLRQQQYSSSSGGHVPQQIESVFTAPTPFAAPPRTSSSASGFALPRAAGISSRWFSTTAPPSSHPLTNASLDKARESGTGPAAGFVQPFALRHVRGMEEDAASNARSPAAHSPPVPSNPAGTAASCAPNQILLVDSNTGAILGTADPRLMMQPQGNAADAAQGLAGQDSAVNISGANSTTTTLSANSGGQSQAQQSQQQQALKPQLEQPNYQTQLAGGMIEDLLHQQHSSTGPTAASAIAQQLLAHPQQLSIQQAESLFQQLANAGVDDETLLTVATATGLITSDAQGNMVLGGSSSGSQASQHPASATSSATNNLVDAQQRLSSGVLQQLAAQQQQQGQQQGQQQSSSMATLAALLQSAANGVSNKANAAGLGPAKQHTLYKTELCRGWLETGTCRYGSKCQFAHGREELRPVPRHPKYKTEVCRSYLATGVCTYGPRCRFIHSALPQMPGLAGGANSSASLTIGSLLASMGAGNQQQQAHHAGVRHSAPNVLDWVPLLHSSNAGGSGPATHMGLEGVSGWDDQPVMSGPTLSGFERPGSFDRLPSSMNHTAPLPSLPAQAAAAQNLLRNMGSTSRGAGGAGPSQPNLFALRANSASSSQQAAAAALMAQANKASASARLSADGLAPAGANMAWNAGDRAAALWAANQSNNNNGSRAAGHSLDGGSTAYSLDLISRSSFDTTQRSSMDSARIGTSRTSLESMQRGTGNFGSGIALNSALAGGRASLDSATSRDARSMGGDMSDVDYTVDGTFSPSKALPPMARSSAAAEQRAGSFGMMMMAAAQGGNNNPSSAIMMAPIPEGKALEPMALQQQQQQQEGAYSSNLYTPHVVMGGGRHSPQDLN